MYSRINAVFFFIGILLPMINSEHGPEKTGKTVCGSEEVGVGEWFNTYRAAYPAGALPHIATWVIFAHDCQQMTTSDRVSSDPSDAGWTLPFKVIGSTSGQGRPVRVITPDGTYDSCYDTQSNCDEASDRGEELTREPVEYCCGRAGASEQKPQFEKTNPQAQIGEAEADLEAQRIDSDFLEEMQDYF